MAQSMQLNTGFSVIPAGQRGALINCGSCGLEFLGPVFPIGPIDSISRETAPLYECICPSCHEIQALAENAVSAAMVCQACNTAFETPAAPWARWRRPVSKVFTRRERRYSLHHLMMHERRRAYPDLWLSPRARRLFEFYCGCCGHLQNARVWEIATQTPCQWCSELMIVPTPCHASRRAASTGTAELFCPQCGQRAPLSDPQRRRNSYCDRCGIWF